MNKYFRIIDNKIYGANASTQGLYFTIVSVSPVIPTVFPRIFVGSHTGSNRLVYTDDGGTNWSVSPIPSTQRVLAIEYSPELDILSSFDYDNGTTTKIAYSTDRGETWSTNTVDDSTAQAYHMTYSPKLKRFVTVNNVGIKKSYYSNDGINYVSGNLPSGADNIWHDIIWADGLEMFLASGRIQSNLNTMIATSTDGINWTTYENNLGGTSISAIGYAPELGVNGRLIAYPLGIGAGAYSDDGVTWTRASKPDYQFRTMAWSPKLGLFAAPMANSVYTSPDGITWTSRSCPNAVWTNIIWNAEQEIFMSISTTNTYMISSNGITWTMKTNIENTAWWGMCNAPKSSNTPPGPTTIVTGGIITTSGEYTIHTFNSSGSLVIEGGSLDIEYLIVAGGGRGGHGINTFTATGGGGAGGLLTNEGTPITLTPSTYTMVVGAGGNNSQIYNGPTHLYGANGGGSGGDYTENGYPGGSGGGGGSVGGAGTPGQGNVGGVRAALTAGGGGGGKGEIGKNATSHNGGAGGAGKTVFGTYFAAGGGGGGSVSGGNGGAGGGGKGGKSTNGSHGTANTGSGGGGVYGTFTGGNGGSGIIKIRYKTNDL